jgi:serpin B
MVGLVAACTDDEKSNSPQDDPEDDSVRETETGGSEDENTDSRGDDSQDTDTGEKIPDAKIAKAYQVSDENAAKVDSDLVSGNTAFALRLLRALVEEAPEKNHFISPVSISVALSMTMNGAVGETLEGMQEALSLSGLTMQDINEQFLSLLKSLEQADEDVLLTLANSIWLNPDYPVKESFIETVENWYLSGVFEADSPDTLNSWIAEKTNGKIEKMIDKFPPELVMYLVNAIYFKGSWTTQFDPQDTYTAAFTKSDDSMVNVDMMCFTDCKDYEAYWGDQVMGIRLPYGRGKIAFYAFAPGRWTEFNIDAFLTNLTAETLEDAFESFRPRELDGLYLPKFKIEYEKELGEILTAFGMEKAFKGGFDNMTDPEKGKPRISFVKHKAFIEVSEEGTEAAAATVVEAVDDDEPEPFRADRPFIFLIRDDRNGTILFIGKVADPTAG